MIFWSILALIIVGLDQLTKYLVVQNIPFGTDISVIPGVIDFTYVKNPGAAFSMLYEHTWLLCIISVVFCVLIAGYLILKKPSSKLFTAALVLVLSGALGNAIDRIFAGSVVDFIETKFINFPVFNVADISVCVGAALLIIYVLFFDNNKEEKSDG